MGFAHHLFITHSAAGCAEVRAPAQSINLLEAISMASGLYAVSPR